MSAERGQNIGELVTVEIVNEFCEPARLRMEPGKIRRHGEHVLARAELFQRDKKTGAQIGVGQYAGGGTAGKIEHINSGTGVPPVRFCPKEEPMVLKHTGGTPVPLLLIRRSTGECKNCGKSS